MKGSSPRNRKRNIIRNFMKRDWSKNYMARKENHNFCQLKRKFIITGKANKIYQKIAEKKLIDEIGKGFSNNFPPFPTSPIYLLFLNNILSI